jgi:hypothetical protein
MKKVEPQPTICEIPSPMIETGSGRGRKEAAVTSAV